VFLANFEVPVDLLNFWGVGFVNETFAKVVKILAAHFPEPFVIYKRRFGDEFRGWQEDICERHRIGYNIDLARFPSIPWDTDFGDEILDLRMPGHDQFADVGECDHVECVGDIAVERNGWKALFSMVPSGLGIG